MKQSIDEQADFIYKGRQYFGLEYYDLYNCLHCHSTITDENIEKHYFNCEKHKSVDKLTDAFLYANRECYGEE